MIDFGSFQFAGAPRSATTWIKQASAEAGLRAGGSVHVPHLPSSAKIRLSTVRHPAEWLRSYWAAIWPGQIQIECVDGLHKACTGAENFDQFLRLYLGSSWSVGRMFCDYGADVVIRVEDLPWAFVEFLESVGVPKSLRERCLNVPAANVARNSKLPKLNRWLRQQIEETEVELMERYEYY